MASYQDKLGAARNTHLLVDWHSKAEHGLEQYTKENCAGAQKIIDDLIARLVAIGETADENAKIKQFEIAVVALNMFNDKADGCFIETGEREDLCPLFDRIAEAAGLDPQKYGGGEGVASEWRDW